MLVSVVLNTKSVIVAGWLHMFAIVAATFYSWTSLPIRHEDRLYAPYVYVRQSGHHDILSAILTILGIIFNRSYRHCRSQ
jgi:hypothetical protein